MEAVLAIITIVSFMLALVSIYQMQRRKDAESVNLTLMTDRLDAVARSLEATFGTVDAIVQTAKADNANAEIVTLGRLARQQLVVTADGLKKSENLVDLWQSKATLDLLKDGRSDFRSGPEQPTPPVLAQPQDVMEE